MALKIESKLIKSILGLLGVLIMGGFGNGVWGYVLLPLLLWISNISTDIYSAMHSSYIDDIYALATSNMYAQTTLKINFLFLTICNFGLCIFLLKNRQTKNSMDSSLNRCLAVIFLIFLCLSFTLLIKLHDVGEISTYTYKGLEIVRPNMTDSEYLELKSQIIQISTKNDFLKISDSLKSHSDISHVLPVEPDL